MPSRPIRYQDAGVDIHAGDRFVEFLQRHAPRIGGFGGVFPLPGAGRGTQLVASTDGVGTKLLVAQALGRHETIGIDLVAMVVNDIVVCGAKPLFFLDYFATGKLNEGTAQSVMKGIIAGCAKAGCELIGGETAEMPGMYAPGHYDLAGFSVGAVDAKDLVDGKSVRPGDVVIGLPSSGVHSNGYSLVRRVIFGESDATAAKHGKGKSKGGAATGTKLPAAMKRKLASKCGVLEKPLADVLLEPTLIYVKPVLDLVKRVKVRGIAHITGSGLPGNIPRALPKGSRCVLDPKAWILPPIFTLLAESGPVAPRDMYDAFNMGIGMVVIVRPEDEARTLKVLRRRLVPALRIGTIEKGPRGVVIDGVGTWKD